MKRVIISLVAMAVVVGGVAAMSAFEAHIINVTAHIENALGVHPEGLAFGTVFPQEYVEGLFTVALSSSFQAEERVDDVEYVIKQKPKCECDEWNTENTQQENELLCPEGRYKTVDYATHLCPEGYTEMENLCQFLSKVDGDPEDVNDTSHPSYFVDPDENVEGDEYCQGQPVRYIGNVLSFSSTG